MAGSKAALISHKRDEVQLKREEDRVKRELCQEQGTVSRKMKFSHTLKYMYYRISSAPGDK